MTLLTTLVVKRSSFWNCLHSCPRLQWCQSYNVTSISVLSSFRYPLPLAPSSPVLLIFWYFHGGKQYSLMLLQWIKVELENTLLLCLQTWCIVWNFFDCICNWQFKVMGNIMWWRGELRFCSLVLLPLLTSYPSSQIIIEIIFFVCVSTVIPEVKVLFLCLQ